MFKTTPLNHFASGAYCRAQRNSNANSFGVLPDGLRCIIPLGACYYMPMCKCSHSVQGGGMQAGALATVHQHITAGTT